jgi:hypothetical protein
VARLKKEPKIQSKHRTKYLPDELTKMLAKAQGRSLAESDYADELVPEFDLVKNYPLTPWHVTQGSGISVYWAADCYSDSELHKFQNTVAARVNAYKNGFKTRGCKLCSTFQYEPSMPIRKHHPEVAREWMEKKNGFLTRFLDTRSARCGLFQCAKDPTHIYRSRVRNRTVARFIQGCPFCYAGKRFNLKNKKYARAFLLYDRTGRNHGFNLTRLPSRYKVFWRCPDGHSWYASFHQVMMSGCKKCLPVEADQQTIADIPALKMGYWASLNNGRSADSILLKGNSGLILNWRCTEVEGDEHIYPARLYDYLLKGSGCSVCAGRKPSKVKCLANEKYEAVLAEVDRSVHPDLNPSAISDRSSKKLSFICSRCRRPWRASVKDRCVRGKGCSSCKAKLRAKKGSGT